MHDVLFLIFNLNPFVCLSRKTINVYTVKNDWDLQENNVKFLQKSIVNPKTYIFCLNHSELL